MAVLSEVSRDIVVPALPFMSDDDGLDMLQEALDKQQKGEDAGILGSVITQALTYTDAETLQCGIDSLRLLDEKFRRKCHTIYQKCEAMSLNSEEQKGAQVLLGSLYQKDPEFRTVLANHQITDGVIANLLQACTMLVNGEAMYRYDGEDFSVNTYPYDLADGLRAIWQPIISDFSLQEYMERGADALNAIAKGADRSAAVAFLQKSGILYVSQQSTGNGGGNGSSLGGQTITPMPKPQVGAYTEIEIPADFADAVLAIHVSEDGKITIPGSFTAPVVYRLQESTLAPVKMALCFDGAIVAELEKGQYIIKEVSSYFTDVSGWSQMYIEALYARGIVGGKAPQQFMPSESITREEFVKLVMELFDMVDSGATTTFADVPREAWYYPYVASAQKYGIVGGISSTEFGVGANIRRQDMAKIICDVLKAKGIAMAVGTANSFNDYAEIAEYAKEHVLSVCGLGIISGDDRGNFNPTQFATRAEASKMVYGMLKTVLERG